MKTGYIFIAGSGISETARGGLSMTMSFLKYLIGKTYASWYFNAIIVENFTNTQIIKYSYDNLTYYKHSQWQHFTNGDMVYPASKENFEKYLRFRQLWYDEMMKKEQSQKQTLP